METEAIFKNMHGIAQKAAETAALKAQAMIHGDLEKAEYDYKILMMKFAPEAPEMKEAAVRAANRTTPPWPPP